MAYDFLNTTTYSNDPLAQGDYSSLLPSSQDTPLGSGFNDYEPDSDLLGIISAQNDEIERLNSQGASIDPTSSSSIQENDLLEDPDPQVDMDILNSMFEEEPQVAEQTRTYTAPPSNEEDEDDTEETSAPKTNGKVAPRIWQYGGKTPKYETGGHLNATTYRQQRIGLNNPNFNTATLNLKGTNTIRGLDNYQPVSVTDGQKYKVLYGPKDTAKFNGPVYEQKMQFGGTVRHVFDPYDPAISSYNDSLALYKKNKSAYEDETHLSYDDLLNNQGNNDVVYTKSGRAIHFNRKPAQQLVYKNIKPSTIQGVETYNSDINVQGKGYKSIDLSQKPTKYSTTYRDGNEQKTIYFKDKGAWKNFLSTGSLSNIDTKETDDSASATGYKTFQFGGELKPETGEVKDFYNNYLNSPNYLKRLNVQGHNNPNQAILDRLAISRI